MLYEFNKQSNPRYPIDDKTLLVRINGYDVIDKSSEHSRLITTHTNTCAGLILLSEDASVASMAHLYSDPRFYLDGENNVREHTRIAWDTIQKDLPSDKKYHAVFFGGRRDEIYEHVSTHEKELTLIARMIEADKKFAAIRESDDFKKLEKTIDALVTKPKKRTARENKELSDLNKIRRNLAMDFHNEFYKGDNAKSMYSAASKVSQWIGSEFYKSVMSTELIVDAIDLRFRKVPHSAVVDLETSSICVGRSERHDLFENPYLTKVQSSRRIFDDYKIHHT